MSIDYRRLRKLFIAALTSGSAIGVMMAACGGTTDDDKQTPDASASGGVGGQGASSSGGGSSGGTGGSGGGLGGGVGYGGTIIDGRPFVVDGAFRTALDLERTDWLWAASCSPVDDCDAPTRAAIAEGWLAAARAEHASIASFARFTLELLAFGAPASLIEASQRASLDEIEHARLCYSLASRFGARAVGPGALSMVGVTLSCSLAESASAAFLEGCVGESIAAGLARAALTGTTDAEARAALERIARDEERHAELAWRFAAWALVVGGAPVRRALAQALTIALSKPREVPATELQVDRDRVHRFGRMSAQEIADVSSAMLDRVIVPCARALAA